MSTDHSDLLRRLSLRVTPQRRAILGAFSGGQTEHLSAEEVHARALREVPELGRGTVYATLAELSELGAIGSVGSAEPVRYEINVEPHDHFRCRLCLRLFDISVSPPSMAPVEKEGFAVEDVSVAAEGVCVECGQYKRGLEDGARSLLDRRLIDEAALATLACSSIDSPLGLLAIAASEDGIRRIAFEEHADFAALTDRARSRRGPRSARARLEHAGSVVDAFFAGSEHQGDDVFDPQALGESDEALLEATRHVPYGETLSYEHFSVDLDPYARGVVFGTNPMPIVFPCHRITRGAEQPEAYVGGAARRQALLTIERESRSAAASPGS
jgi:Fe2+ or Zn2+ uptake regulation protein/O6-methylguanine-DNA--protein-cysteine methyltransferase